MHQIIPPDPEVGGGPGSTDDSRDHPSTKSNQTFQVESEEPNFWDSSGPLFSIYYNAAKDEDSKMVNGWQKDAEGIVIFTGLFSAAVAALLAVSVQDLRPNSQDTSAFYLGIIYQVLADPNATRPSIPSPVANPTRFTPPRHAVWVNSLWFLSLVMGLSCALWATSLQQWARRYLRMAQPAQCGPEKRARMRAFFANGVEKMHVPWAVDGLPTLLHLSLSLFFGGLVIYLFNIDREVFSCVIWWIGLFSMAYGFVTLLPIIRHDSPYNSPLSTPTWFLYARIRYLTFKILAFITYRGSWSHQTWERCEDLRDRSQKWMLGGVEKAAEETALERLAEIDDQILDWTISTLGDDYSLKNFFEAIPGFFNSKLVVKHLKRNFSEELRKKIRDELDGFLDRTWSSNSVDDSEKIRRLDISMNAMHQIDASHVWIILYDILTNHWDEVPQTVEMGHTLARWCTSNNQLIARYAQAIIAGILVSVRERNDSWFTLAARVFVLPERDLPDNIALGGDSVLLAILIRLTRQHLRSDYLNHTVLEELSELSIHNTLPKLQHDFCTLWNEIVRKARDQGPRSTHVGILRLIRHPYITLHQGTGVAPTAFSASTKQYDDILFKPSSYPFCNLASHHTDSISQISNSHEVPLPTPLGSSPDASSYPPADIGDTASRQAKQVNNVMGLPLSSNPTTTRETRVTSHGPDMNPQTKRVHFSSRPTGASPKAVVAATRPAPQEPGTGQISSTASTHAPVATLAPIPVSLRSTPSESHNAGVASVSNSSHFAPPSIGSPIPASRPTSSPTLPRLRVRGLVNTGNICFVNAVLQLLVNSPPFRNLVGELVNQKRQRGAGVPGTGGSATPLVDATVRFFKEFIVEEESPSTQQQSQPTTSRTLRADEEKKSDYVVDSFEPTYMYDAMKEKRNLKPLLDGQQQDAEEFLCLYLDALDEELLSLLAPISGHQSSGAVLEAPEVSQSGQAEVGSHGFTANFVESPTARILGWKLHSPACASNKPDLFPTEDWRSLHLDIQPNSIRSVQDALAHISHPQSVQVSASGLGNAIQQVLIDALPPVLVLHLNRVRYNVAASSIVKIGKSIQLTPELEIPLDIMVPNAQRPSEPPHYKLYGVLYHHGESAGSGHYTVDVLHPNRDGDTGEVWLHVDDEAVSPMQHEDMFGEKGTDQAVDERCAYLLFYCRISPMGSS